jgi:hypothetical protein
MRRPRIEDEEGRIERSERERVRGCAIVGGGRGGGNNEVHQGIDESCESRFIAKRQTSHG